MSRTLELFEVSEKGADYLTTACPNVTVHHSTVSRLDFVDQTISWAAGSQTVRYDKLCVCTGGVPNVSERTLYQHSLTVAMRGPFILH